MATSDIVIATTQEQRDAAVAAFRELNPAAKDLSDDQLLTVNIKAFLLNAVTNATVQAAQRNAQQLFGGAPMNPTP